MSKEKIESRRAFMKKLGKLTGAAAVAAPFMSMAVKEAVAKPNEDNPTTGCRSCDGGCSVECCDDCMMSCRAKCGGGCGHTCSQIVWFK